MQETLACETIQAELVCLYATSTNPFPPTQRSIW